MARYFMFLFMGYCLMGCNSNAQDHDDPAYRIALEKLNYITDHLDGAVEFMRYDNKNLLKRIRQEVATKGNKSYDLEEIKKAEQVVKLTDDLFSKLALIKNELSALAENNLASIHQQNDLMFEQHKGADIKELVNGYVKEINKVGKRQYPMIFPEIKEANTVELFFKNSPTVATLGTIASFEIEICNYERSILDEFAASTGTK